MSTPAEFLKHLNIFTQKEWMTGEEAKIIQLVRSSIANNTSVSDALKEYDEWVAVYGKRVTRVVLEWDHSDLLQGAFRDKLIDIITPWDDSSYEMASNAMDWLEYEMKTYDVDGFSIDAWEDDMNGEDSFYEETGREAKCYNAALFNWLSENITHHYHVNEAMEEYGDLTDVSKAIAIGMAGMAREIYSKTISAVAEMFEEHYEEEEDE